MRRSSGLGVRGVWSIGRRACLGYDLPLAANVLPDIEKRTVERDGFAVAICLAPERAGFSISISTRNVPILSCMIAPMICRSVSIYTHSICEGENTTLDKGIDHFGLIEGRGPRASIIAD
jgi:hypothetical protein